MLIAFSKGAHTGQHLCRRHRRRHLALRQRRHQPRQHIAPMVRALPQGAGCAQDGSTPIPTTPYTTRAATDVRPSAPPPRPKVQVTLGNLPVLLKIFPTRAVLPHGVLLQHRPQGHKRSCP